MAKRLIGDEIWKEVPGYEGKYFVSNQGRVKSVWRYRNIYVEGHRQNVKIYKEQIMTPTDNGHGYLIIALKMNGKRKNGYIHRLVAEAFIENPNNLPVVNHIDYDKTNNVVSNLEWCTQKENIQHSKTNMTKQHFCKTSTGERYITKYKNHYRVHFRKAKIHKLFPTLESAVAFRNEVMNEINYSI